MPADLIPPAVRAELNGLLEHLGYVGIDETWGTPSMPPDPRAVSIVAGARPESADEESRLRAESHILDDRLRNALAVLPDSFRARWARCTAEPFMLVSRSLSGTAQRCWIVDAGRGVLVTNDAAGDDCDWCLIGSPGAWTSVLAGEVGLSVAIRAGDLRYFGANREDPLITHDRMTMVGELLGLISWGRAVANGSSLPAHA